MEVGDLQFLGVLSGGLLSRLIGLPSGSGQLLGLVDGDDIGKELLGTNSALGIGSLHDLHLGTEHTLLHQHVAHGLVDEFLAGETRLDHVTLLELHRVRTLLAQLTGDDDLATLGTGLERAADHSVSSTTHGKTSQQLVLQGLHLGLGAQAALVHTLGVQDYVVLVEAESTPSALHTPRNYLFWTRAVSSLMRREFSPITSWGLGARIMISVLRVDLRTLTPE